MEQIPPSPSPSREGGGTTDEKCDTRLKTTADAAPETVETNLFFRMSKKLFEKYVFCKAKPMGDPWLVVTLNTFSSMMTFVVLWQEGTVRAVAVDVPERGDIWKWFEDMRTKLFER